MAEYKAKKISSGVYEYDTKHGIITLDAEYKVRESSGIVGEQTINIQFTMDEYAEIVKKHSPESKDRHQTEARILEVLGCEKSDKRVSKAKADTSGKVDFKSLDTTIITKFDIKNSEQFITTLKTIDKINGKKSMPEDEMKEIFEKYQVWKNPKPAEVKTEISPELVLKVLDFLNSQKK